MYNAADSYGETPNAHGMPIQVLAFRRLFTISRVRNISNNWTLLALIYWYVAQKYKYWKRKDIPYVEPVIPYGNMKDVLRSTHIGDKLSELYRQMKGQGPIGGIYLFHKPIALILDPKLIKNILIKDFQYFMDRDLFYNEKDDPLSAHLLSLNADEWKELRGKLTPTFTSGKMKYMFPTITKVGNEFKEALEVSVKTSNDIEVKDYLARFTTDVIGTCAFGIDCNSLKEPDSEFRQMGRKLFDPEQWRLFKAIIFNFSQKLARFLGLKINTDDISKFFINVVSETITFREKNHVTRNDFMDLMIQLKNNKSDLSNGLSFNQVAAQAFLFFGAGFETSSTLMAFALYELAFNKDIQSKARQEIDEVLRKHNGEFTYEAMMDMKFIDQIINKTLRKYSPLSFLIRRTKKDYQVPGTDYTFHKDQLVWIPVHALHHDPEYYPDPEKFDPDRFTPEAIEARDAMTFLPFGDGPRHCIGLRFGQMQARVGLVTILKHFDASPSLKTQIPLAFVPGIIIRTPLGGIWLKITKLQC